MSFPLALFSPGVVILLGYYYLVFKRKEFKQFRWFAFIGICMCVPPYLLYTLLLAWAGFSINLFATVWYFVYLVFCNIFILLSAEVLITYKSIRFEYVTPRERFFGSLFLLNFGAFALYVMALIFTILYMVDQGMSLYTILSY